MSKTVQKDFDFFMSSMYPEKEKVTVNQYRQLRRAFFSGTFSALTNVVAHTKDHPKPQHTADLIFELMKECEDAMKAEVKAAGEDVLGVVALIFAPIIPPDADPKKN